MTGGIYSLDLHATGFGVINYTGTHIIKRVNSSSDWTLDGTHVPTTGSNALPILHRTELSGFSEFGVGGESNVLPVELIMLKGKCENKSIVVYWQTASETNNDYFILEKSNDMVNFYEIARIKGAGNSLSISNYEFVDKIMFNGNNYYRLKQVDFDGKAETFNAISINCDNENNAKVYVYPNPFKSELNFNFENIDNQKVEIQIYNKIGQLLLVENIYTQGPIFKTSISLKYLKPAIYNIRIITEHKVYNFKTVKQ